MSIRVLANGCFDILHSGHIEHLKAAKALGDHLTVALTVDDCVNKPGLPVNTWDERAAVLRELRCVDSVVPSKSDVEAIYSEKPDIFVKGIDYHQCNLLEPAKKACATVGAKIVLTTTAKRSSRDILTRFITSSSNSTKDFPKTYRDAV